MDALFYFEHSPCCFFGCSCDNGVDRPQPTASTSTTNLSSICFMVLTRSSTVSVITGGVEDDGEVICSDAQLLMMIFAQRILRRYCRSRRYQ